MAYSVIEHVLSTFSLVSGTQSRACNATLLKMCAQDKSVQDYDDQTRSRGSLV